MTPSRREFLQATGAVGAAAMASGGSRPVQAGAQIVMNQESRTVQTAVLNIGYEESGRSDGFPIVLLHGFPETSAMWIPLIKAASAAGYRVVAFDQRGYSPGARPGKAVSYTHLRAHET